jgi:hypothetical protein
MNKQESLKILESMDKQANLVSTLRDELAELLKNAEREQQAIVDRYMKRITDTSRKASKAQEQLLEMVKNHPTLFTKPKSRKIGGISFGLKKQKGKIVFKNAEALIKSIRALIKKGDIPQEMEGQLIKTTEKPIADGVGNLSGEIIKKLGVEVKESSDAAFIKGTDSDLSKLVDAALKDTSLEKLEEVF